jgi:predicted O-methyltransferase YrrM
VAEKRALIKAELKLRREAALRKAARKLGWHLVRADYYSPIVDAAALPPTAFSEPAPMHGIDLHLDLQLKSMTGDLEPYLSEWNPPLHPPGDQRGFHLHNPFYAPLDSHLLYALVRHRKPNRIIELGSGYSTLVIRDAAEANARDGTESMHTVIDPHPSYLVANLQGITREKAKAEDLPLETFEALESGDFLFLDTTHVVRVGGDVTRLILEVMPALKPGTLVHFHDIFRPFEYPRELYERFNKHWQEQYLLEAFLAYNQNFEVIAANHALARLHREQITQLIPSLKPGMHPSAFWVQKRVP